MSKLHTHPTLAGLATLAFFVLAMLWMLYPATGEPSQLSLLNALVMVVGMSFLTATQSYFRSSKGSAAKEKTIRTIAVNALSNLAAPAAAVDSARAEARSRITIARFVVAFFIVGAVPAFDGWEGPAMAQVTSLGGQTGALACAATLTCSGGSVGVNGFVIPQNYNANCGTAGQDCTAGLSSCLGSGVMCFLPCGTYDTRGSSYTGTNAVTLMGSGYCSIIEITSTILPGITVGGSTTLIGGIVENLLIQATVKKTSGAGLRFENCFQCRVINVEVNGGNIWDGIVFYNSGAIGVVGVNVDSVLNNGITVAATNGAAALSIDTSTIVVSAGNYGYYLGGGFGGANIEGAAILCAYGLYADTSLSSGAKNGQIFLGPDSDFDTNTYEGILLNTDSVGPGGSNGLVFKGWSSSNGSYGLYVANQGGIWVIVNGGVFLGNGNDGIGDADTGWFNAIGGFFLNNNGLGIGFGPDNMLGVISGNMFSGNNLGSVSGFTQNATHVCATNVGQSSESSGC